MVRYRIKELAKARKMTQFDLAIKSGVSMTVVQRLWQNHRALGDVRYSTLDAISTALAVPIADLFAAGGEDSEEIQLQGNKKSRVVVAC